MSEDVFRIVITAGVTLACLSAIVQAFVIFNIYRTAKSVEGKVTALSERAEPILNSAKGTLEEVRPKIREMTDRALDVASIAKSQAEKIDKLLSETEDKARVQIERINEVVEEAVSRVHDTTAAVQATILRPVREVNGVVNGVRAAIGVLARGNRASVDHATQDEEMFI